MARIGDKFEIEIEEVFKGNNDKILYRMKGFNSLVFDEQGIEKLNYMTSKNADLKPCPMCGGKAEFCGWTGPTYHVMCT
jgi:hypothetical protein